MAAGLGIELGRLLAMEDGTATVEGSDLLSNVAAQHRRLVRRGKASIERARVPASDSAFVTSAFPPDAGRHPVRHMDWGASTNTHPRDRRPRWPQSPRTIRGQSEGPRGSVSLGMQGACTAPDTQTGVRSSISLMEHSLLVNRAGRSAYRRSTASPSSHPVPSRHASRPADRESLECRLSPVCGPFQALQGVKWDQRACFQLAHPTTAGR